jgi:hypothetical protein
MRSPPVLSLAGRLWGQLREAPVVAVDQAHEVLYSVDLIADAR